MATKLNETQKSILREGHWVESKLEIGTFSIKYHLQPSCTCKAKWAGVCQCERDNSLLGLKTNNPWK